MNSRKALDLLATTLTALVFAFSRGPAALAAVHVWEKQELTFASANSYANPYTDVLIWVDLNGPGFRRRIYGFWDGGRSFKVRLVATKPGQWTWISGSEPQDAGLAGKRGSFAAMAWTDEEKKENSLRRGFLRATANGHALETADGPLETCSGPMGRGWSSSYQ